MDNMREDEDPNNQDKKEALLKQTNEVPDNNNLLTRQTNEGPEHKGLLKSTNECPDHKVMLKQTNEEADYKDRDFMPLRTRALLTAPVVAAFLAFSICRGFYGPTLGELQKVTGTRLEQISTLFTWLGIGGIAGSLTFGHLFDHNNPILLFVLTVVPLGLLTMFIPWCDHFVVMMVLVAAQSFFFNGVNVGCNVTMVRLWKGYPKASRPTLTAMHFLFTVGGFLAPQIAQPFISTAMPRGTTNFTQLVNTMELNVSQPDPITYDISRENTTKPKHDFSYKEAEFSLDNDRTSTIYYGYLIVGVYIEFVGVWMILLLIIFKDKYNWKSWLRGFTIRDEVTKTSRTKIGFVAASFFIILIFFLGGQEIMYIGLLYTFAVEYLGVDVSEGTLLVSVLFITYGVGRFIFVFISSKIHPRYVLTFDLLLGISSALFLSLYPGTSTTLLWILNVLLGLSMCTVFSVGVMWAETFVVITGKFMSAYIMSFATGIMIWPAITGLLYRKWGPMWFAHMNSALVIACGLCLIPLHILHYQISHKKPPEKVVCVPLTVSGIPSRMKEERGGMMASLQSLHTI